MRTIIIKKPPQFVINGVVLAGLLLAMPLLAKEIHTYTVEVDAALSRLSVQAKFDTATSDIAARSRSAAQYLLDARNCDDGRRVNNRGRRLSAPRAGFRCLNYTVDLRKAAQAERRNDLLHESNIVVSPSVWMWRPLLDSNDEIHVRFHLPENVQVSVPWRPIPSADNAYVLSASPRSGNAIAIFGNFDSSVRSVAGSNLRVVLMRTAKDLAATPIFEWIDDAARNITLTYGRFPNPAARVVVFPMGSGPWRSDSPVYFGRVVRDGGETVELLIDPGQPIEAYYKDWTATHELSHMMLPYLRSEQRWISEGFAQYYQNLLLARAGHLTHEDAWQRLYEGFERGRDSVPQLSPNAAARGEERSSRMKVYWSGAALALMADVELRRRSGGSESLDQVLGELQRCCLPSQRRWSGRELFARLDSFLDEPVFMNLYRQHADARGFPDVRPLLHRLGVVVESGKVRLESDAELAETRATLTAQRYTGAPGR